MIVKEKLLTMSDAGDSNEESDVDPLSIYIGNLDHRVTSLDLASHFHSVGEVDKVTVLRNNDTGEHRGAAYVQFKDLRGLQRALSLDGCFIAGKNVRIKRKRKFVDVEGTKRLKRKRKTSSVEDTNNNKRTRISFSVDEALSAPHKSSQVYVGNLDLDTSKQDLEEHFKSTGDIVRVIVMKKGKVAWAFIQFNDLWSVEGALFMNGTVLRDRVLKVQRKRSIKANN